jgi:hypothetical protein
MSDDRTLPRARPSSREAQNPCDIVTIWAWLRGSRSARPPQPSPFAPLAQLDRASGYEPGGRTFESCRAHQSFPRRNVEATALRRSHFVLAPPVLPCDARILSIWTSVGSSIKNSGSRSRWWMRVGSPPVKRAIASTLSQYEIVMNSVSSARSSRRLCTPKAFSISGRIPTS